MNMAKIKVYNVVSVETSYGETIVLTFPFASFDQASEKVDAMLKEDMEKNPELWGDTEGQYEGSKSYSDDGKIEGFSICPTSNDWDSESYSVDIQIGEMEI